MSRMPFIVFYDIQRWALTFALIILPQLIKAQNKNNIKQEQQKTRENK